MNNITPDLREAQLKELEIFLQFKKICDENGLKYYLTGGTLIGAVRHRGFIPWDDDMDILMPRKDYDEFARLQESVLPEGYYYQSSELDGSYPNYFAKLRKGYADAAEQEQEFIDIFPLDICPYNDIAALLYFKLMAVINYAIADRLLDNFVCGYTRFYMRLLWGFLRRLPTPFLFRLRRWLRFVVDHLASGARVCNIAGRYGFPGEMCLTEWFAVPATLEFEGYDCSVPSGWHELLTHMYGDYMTPPAEDDRHGHFFNP